MLNNAQRALVLDEWLKFERKHGDEVSQAAIRRRVARRVKKLRPIYLEDGSATEATEEYHDYLFPEDESSDEATMDLLNKAKLWKERQQQMKAAAAGT